VTRTKRLRLVVTVLLSYLLLWGGTQVVGVPAVQVVARAEHPLPADIPLRWSECHSFAIGPFLVKSKYGWLGTGALEGLGGATVYLWFGRTIPLWELEHWMG
jgi:hypothetical protein